MCEGSCQTPGRAEGGPSKTIPPRTSTIRLDELARRRRTRARRRGSSSRARCEAAAATPRSHPAPRRRRRSWARRARAAPDRAASAFAMNARCCWPPESVVRRRSALWRSARPGRSARCTDLAVGTRSSGPIRRVREARPAVTSSRTVDAARRFLPAPAAAGSRPCRTVELDAARGRVLEPDHRARTSVVLPPPFGPAIATNSPRSHLEIDVPQHRRRVAVGERHALEAKG